MRQMRIALSALSLLAVAACGQAPDQEPAAEATPAEAPVPVEPDGGIGDGASAPDAAEEALANRIPTRFHGVWDYVEGTCARESDMRMEVSGGEILQTLIILPVKQCSNAEELLVGKLWWFCG